MQVKPRKIDNNGIDDDGNGLVDDVLWMGFCRKQQYCFDGVDDTERMLPVKGARKTHKEPTTFLSR
jgi:hypothetical protein